MISEYSFDVLVILTDQNANLRSKNAILLANKMPQNLYTYTY